MARFGERVGRLAVLAAVSWMLVSPLWAQDANPLGADDVARGLQRWLDETTDLQGSFRQALLSGAFGTGIEERGKSSGAETKTVLDQCTHHGHYFSPEMTSLPPCSDQRAWQPPYPGFSCKNTSKSSSPGEQSYPVSTQAAQSRVE